VGLSPVRLIPW